MKYQVTQERSAADWIELYDKLSQCHHSTLSPTDGRVIWRRYRSQLLLKLLLDTAKTFNVTSVLDIGSEEGFFTAQLSHQGLDVTALDLSMGRLLDMRTREQVKDIKMIQGDASRLPLADNSYDMVLVLDIIEHIPDFDMAVTESIRIAKKCWVFSTNMHGLHRRIACAVGMKGVIERADRRIGHLHVFTYSNLKRRLRPYIDELSIKKERNLFTLPPIITALTLNGLLRGSFASTWLDLFNAVLPKISKNWFANWIVMVAFKEDA